MQKPKPPELGKAKVSFKPNPVIPEATHAYCENCCAIRPVTIERLERVKSSDFVAGDILCECRFVIATLYRKGD